MNNTVTITLIPTHRYRIRKSLVVDGVEVDFDLGSVLIYPTGPPQFSTLGPSWHGDDTASIYLAVAELLAALPPLPASATATRPFRESPSPTPETSP